MGESHKVGPDLTYIGITAAERVPNMTAEEYLRQSILEPNAYLAPECPNTSCLPGIMPQNFHLRLTDDQLNTVVAFLMTQQGPAPTPVPIGSGLSVTATPKSGGSSKVATPVPAPSMSSTTVGTLIIILMLALSAVLIAKGFVSSRKR